MNLSDAELETVEELAGLFYSPGEVAVILEVDPEGFGAAVSAGCGGVYRAYTRGYYQGDVDLRKCITESALQGSSPAQAMLREIQKLGKIKS